MPKYILAFAIAVLGLSAPAYAQISIPYTFSAITRAQSAQVNANFSATADALNRTGGTMTGTLNSQHVLPTTDNTYDLGSASYSFRDIFADRNVAIGGTLTAGGTVDFASSIQAGSGNVTIVDTTGKIPALSSAYFASLSGANLTSLNANELSSGTVPSARLSGMYIPLSVFDNTYNDGSAHTATAVALDKSGILIIGNTTIPFWSNGGSGVAYVWTTLDPDTGWRVGTNGSFSFTDPASGGNTYTVDFAGGSGDITVTRTGGANSYRMRVFTF